MNTISILSGRDALRTLGKTASARPYSAVALAALLALGGGCRTADSVRSKASAATPLPACCRVEPAAATPSGGSIHNLQAPWTSDLGKTITLGHFRGRLVVLTMFFSTCEFACPLLVQDLKRLEAALPESLRDEVDFVLVSFDTVRDTPQVLAAYRTRQSLDPARWCLLTGKPDDVRELAAVLGISYAQDARGQFMHSNILTVLDPDGEVSHQEMGLNRPLDGLLGTLARLSTARAAAPASGGAAPPPPPRPSVPVSNQRP